jgi:hypothetical protein
MKSILIPLDFTPVTQHVLAYAADFCWELAVKEIKLQEAYQFTDIDVAVYDRHFSIVLVLCIFEYLFEHLQVVMKKGIDVSSWSGLAIPHNHIKWTFCLSCSFSLRLE